MNILRKEVQLIAKRIIATEMVFRNLKKQLVGERTMKRTENVVRPLHELRKLLKNENAVLWGKENEKALILTTHEQDDGLVVLSTGCGKSMMFLIPAFIKKLVCTEMFLLVALVHELLRRCLQMGIQYGGWKKRYAARPKILFISAENVVRDEYHSFVEELHARGVFHAIFVGEAHLFVHWHEF